MKKKQLQILLFGLIFILCFLTQNAIADFYVISAGGQRVGTKISSLPSTISTPGFYYLTGDLAMTAEGIGIIINSDNVTIDLMGFSIIGPGSGNGSGIYMASRSNVEIRNGTIRDFFTGILEANIGRNHRITNVRAVGNRYRGISLTGEGHLVENCTASGNENDGISVASGSIVTGNTACNNGSDGISVWAGCNVIDNTVYGNDENGIFIRLAQCLVDRNTAYDNNQSGGSYSNITSCPTCTFGLNHAP
jgi:parallel beta-helix repeat protein